MQEACRPARERSISKLFPNIEQVPGKTANECGYFSRTAAVAIARAQLREHTPSVIRSLELRETIERRVFRRRAKSRELVRGAAKCRRQKKTYPAPTE